MPPAALTGHPLRTYEALMGAPPARNASWDDVRGLLEAIADVTVEETGNITAARNGHVLTLHPALTKDIAESGEVTALRRFLQASELRPTVTVARDPHLLLVLQGPQAKLYRCQVLGGVPQLILPYEAAVPNPEDSGYHSRVRAAKLQHPDGFFAAVAEDLQAAGQIVIFDTGNEAADFVARLSQHDSEVSGRIIGTVHLGESPLDPAGLLAAARAFYASRVPAAAPPS